MKIIAGTLRGRPIKTLQGDATRPTSGLVRGAMFNILGPRIQGARLLDLYTGSGAIAFEALSRGAQSAVLVEQAPDAQRIILDNLAALKLADRASLIRGDVMAKLATLRGPFDLVIADPPYRAISWPDLLMGLQAHHLLDAAAIVLAEYARGEEVPEQVGELVRSRTYAYGVTQLARYDLRGAGFNEVLH